MSNGEMYDLVLSNGRVMDPESGLDRVRNLGISEGKIVAVSEEAVLGRETIDAGGLVVSAGFIDMHSHGQDAHNYAVQAMDGVTTALELELGASDVDLWYDARRDNALINYGASVGHIPIRMDVMGEPKGLVPRGDAANRAATEAELEETSRRIRRGLDRGALAVGFGIQYTPAASRWEILEAFRVAAQYGATCHVHMRGMGHVEPAGAVDGLQELIAASVITGTPVHIAHISSSGLSAAPMLLQIIGEAQGRGIDATTESYAHDAALTDLGSALFDEGWQTVLGIGYHDLQWVETGERLDSSTFARYRETGGLVVMHMIPEETVQAAVTSPLTAIATDGLLQDGKGHPRTAGSYSRVLGRFVREDGSLTLMAALRKMSLMPALTSVSIG